MRVRGNKTGRVGIRIDPVLLLRVQQLAQEQKRTVSAIINTLIQWYISQHDDTDNYTRQV